MSLGIIPGFAGTQRLPQYVGTAKAYEMILSAQPISGEEAYTYGLANQVVSEEDLIETSERLAEQIAAKSGPTIRKVMELIPYAKTSMFDEGVKKEAEADRKSTRLNSSHVAISYAVFCLKKKKQKTQ